MSNNEFRVSPTLQIYSFYLSLTILMFHTPASSHTGLLTYQQNGWPEYEFDSQKWQPECEVPLNITFKKSTKNVLPFPMTLIFNLMTGKFEAW